jgi:uncharacterized protein (DUF1499 family)
LPDRGNKGGGKEDTMRILPNLAKLVFAGFIVSLVIGLGAGFGKQLGLWGFQFGLLKLFPWCIYIGLGALALGIIWLIAAAIARNWSGGRWGIIGTIGAIAVVAFPLYNLSVARSVPPIHDITTDIANPPQFRAVLPLRKAAHALNSPVYDGNAKIMWHGKSMTVAQAQRKAYTDIHTIQILTTPAKLFDRALKAAKAMGWHIVAANPNEGRIEATDTTFFFGFTDDIVIRVRPSGMGAKLDIRSESRVGISDIGKNAHRIRAFVKELAKTKA